MMRSPAPSWVRRSVGPAAVLAACLTPAPAAAGHIITFTGEFADSFSESNHFDGTAFVPGQLPPLFDLARLDGGSFRATILVPDVPPLDGGNFNSAEYEYLPPAPLAFTLFDAAGAAVHEGRGVISSATVQNDRTRRGGGPGPRPPEKIDAVILFEPGVGAVTGLALPPELYGPNAVIDENLDFEFVSRFLGGSGPLDAALLPTDGGTYLAFDERTFSLVLNIGNGDLTGQGGPSVDVYTEVSYTVTGASVAPTAAVPEPASVGLLAAGGLGLLGYARRRGAATA